MRFEIFCGPPPSYVPIEYGINLDNHRMSYTTNGTNLYIC